ncbi:tetratricopeptide repeat protein [Gramella lutea]|uniref:Tetratricopeptide repeat protein n=1 Tax=Christiangramia lutea TaxID=1607951 RepID=A0A9X1V1S8_9FLAO|nr:adenylate/guanylate cyclase domain-containing protein [Christiangramia lutea]MCH4822081.1 tetratricopeptide repeat protein [Christiangramia lutea]
MHKIEGHRKMEVRILAILLFSCFFFTESVFSQTLSEADSLESIYENGSKEQKKDLKLLRNLAGKTNEPNKKLKYSRELIEESKNRGIDTTLYFGFLQIGNAYVSKADYSKALDNYFKASNYARTDSDAGIIKLTIADVYSLTNNYERSVGYYEEAIEYFKKANDSLALGSALFNAGDGYLKANQLEKAENYIIEAEDIFNAINYSTGIAYCTGTLGLIYAEQGKNDEAEENIQKAIQLLEKEEDYSPISEFLTGMAEIYTEKDQDSIALEFAFISRDLAKSYGFKNEIIQANQKLAQIYEKTGNIPEAYKYYKEYIFYRDSVLNVETAQNIAGLRADYEVSQKQAEIDLLSEQRRNQQILVISIAVVTALIGLLAFGLFRRNRYINRTSSIIEKERNRAELLLLNILPEQTAEELKKNGRVKAKKFASVTVLFADFKRFTLVAEKLPPERLIKTIDYYFSQFDKITDKYGIEKIKTIGDSYMAVGGLPYPSHDHATRMLLAAFEMTEFVKETKEKSLFDDADFEVRIGLNSGPVVAGVVGTKKFAYDIWGDTVNIAARMESHSEIGRINISENTYDLIKDEFECEYRGKVEVKNQRILKMYYVNAVKEGVRKKAV